MASGSGGKVPPWLRNESGFPSEIPEEEDEDKEDTEEDETPRKPPAKKRLTSAEKALQNVRSSQGRLAQLTDGVSFFLKDKKRAALDSFDLYMEEINRQSKHAATIQNDDVYSPGTKAALVEKINKRKQRIGQKILSLKDDDENEGSDD